MATLVTTKDHAANKPQAATHDRATSGWRSIYRILGGEEETAV